MLIAGFFAMLQGGGLAKDVLFSNRLGGRVGLMGGGLRLVWFSIRIGLLNKSPAKLMFYGLDSGVFCWPASGGFASWYWPILPLPRAQTHKNISTNYSKNRRLFYLASIFRSV